VAGEKLHIHKVLRQEIGYEGDVLFTEHHEAHVASAFYPSPFKEAAVLTVDGVGEWATASYGFGKGNEITLLKELHFPDSLGLLYSAFTYFTGFRVNSGEYKLMGLAPYGRPCYKDLILSELIDVKDDGSLRLNLAYFDFLGGLRMTNRHFSRLFGGSPRKPETEITQREMDIAASIQSVTEEIILRW
jgi:carbamoyltransferase